jgi:DNA-binding IclR family transcriptional regulator
LSLQIPTLFQSFNVIFDKKERVSHFFVDSVFPVINTAVHKQRRGQMGAMESNKAKIAKRVIEVLEFFDDQHPQATVMDIVRRYDRPQSSTSELLSSLVDLGLLYKDATTRSYTLTPRAAMLGAISQPPIIRDGTLTSLIDRLVAQTGLNVGVFGLIGTNAQIFSWRSGQQNVRTINPKGMCGGLQERMSDSAVGQLLLSTIPQPRREGMIRRLNAESPEERKFSAGEMSARIQSIRDSGFAIGVAGFGTQADVCAMLLPNDPDGHPMAIGFIYEPSDQIDPLALVNCLRDAISRATAAPAIDPTIIQPITPAYAPSLAYA